MNTTTTLTTGTTTATVTTGPQKRRDLFDLLGLAVLNTGWYLIIGAGVAVHWAILFPVISVPFLLAGISGYLFGWPVGVAEAAYAVVVIFGFRRRFPDLFARWVTDRARTRFLTWWRYRRNWTRLMKACRLTTTTETGTATPKLLAVGIGDGTDRVQLRMLEGQSPADFEMRAETIAHAFKAEQCHASIVGPATVELRFRHGDALADTVLAPRVDQWTKPEGVTA
ncbi:hypothetical protein AB0H42_20185 [Nocardia sp. NPDC050799]|uniref:hypothetical protein n=1 Tax=Nocardia sp. NPDC050799 TaxID=3154842 RepID=UPI0033DA9077